MAPRELSRHQLSSKLSYQAHVPAFLQKLQNRMAGVPDAPSDEDEPQYEEEEFEYVGGGRPPIPRRPPIPKRPASQPGSGDERGNDDRDESGDEKPQIVVLREGKHLNEREVENIKRKEKGLPPLPEATEGAVQETSDARVSEESKDSKSASAKSTGLSFSSGKPTTKTSASTKRKAISQPDSDSENDLATQIGIRKPIPVSEGSKAKEKEKNKEKPKKKPKKETKKLLSFGDDA